ncbi:alpha/beta hydrolase [Labedella populi]|uniref:Alpha/beta hydrolase n=1 Tax=Labedella populi TaxID=2498850 RepID=A0A444QB87_9MICO|nr:alpha/beta hydrolase [Labedella populi]RWZ61329.1 alpha/beta hydrolase [Labedella populi]
MVATSPYEALLRRVPVTEHATTVLESSTAWWEYGRPDAPITVVLVHGFRGDHHGLEPVVAHLDGYRLIAPDLPGFGSSAALADGHDIAGYSRWLRAFVAAVAPGGGAIVLGHSFGSIVASTAVADGLETPALILVNPIAAPALSGPRGVLTRLAVFYYWIAAALPERLGFALLRNRVIVRVMSEAMVKTRERSLRAWIHAQHQLYFSGFASRRVVLEAFRASVSNDVSMVAERIGVPTLLVAAERDDITPVAAQHRLRDLFADAELEVIPSVGHLIHYEVPAAAAGHIDSFLSRRRR